MNRFLFLFAALALLLQPAARVAAHEGHNTAPGEAGAGPLNGPVTLTAEAEKNLGLKVEVAELRTLEKTVAQLRPEGREVEIVGDNRASA